jgi:hypothetical protein
MEMENEETRELEPDGKLTRSLTTDAAIVAAPTIAVVANHLLNRPEKEAPQKPVLPPGVDIDK